MKNFKRVILSIVMGLLIFSSCNNEEVIINPQELIEESESITDALNFMSKQFDANGNVVADENPAGDIVFDFCFNFIYPIDLSFNTGATITINSLEELVTVVTASTEELFINGIAFPFEVETYNEDSNSLEIETINNEDEFNSLLEDCELEENDDCICTEIYDPVCIDITDLDGEVFTISYPNSCYAICDGFTEEDFSEECEGDYANGLDECFDFVYPIAIILDDSTAVNINSNEELFNTIYGVHYFDFVFPFEVLIEIDTVITINNYDQLEDIIENCFDDGYGTIDCSIEDIASALINCFWQIDFVDDDQYLYNFFNDGTYQVQSGDSLLTSGEWIINDGNETFYITLAANSPNYNDEWVVTICDENLEMQSLVSPQAELYSIDCYGIDLDCSVEDVVVLLSDCSWLIDFIDFNEFSYNFNTDGTYEVQDLGGNSNGSILTTGVWGIDVTNNSYTIYLIADDSQYNDTWLISDCDEDELTIESIDYPQADIYSINCD